MTASEVLTLQFGNYSNYIAAHYWNIQENQFVYSGGDSNKSEIPDVNHDVLFREGITSQNRLSYTPRMMLFDLKENVNFIKSVNYLQNTPKSKLNNWDGNVQLFETDKKPVSRYSIDLEQKENEDIENEKRKIDNKRLIYLNGVKDNYQMDDEVKYWSDFMKLKYHDRSFLLFNTTRTSVPDSNSEPFDLFTHGSDFVNDSAGLSESFEDSFRHFAEECDHIQGFQMFVDAYDGFGGLASKSLTYIAEEFTKSPVMAFLPFPHYNHQDHDSNTYKLINTSFTLKNLFSVKENLTVLPLGMFNSFYMEKEFRPVNLYSTNYNSKLNYHTSAILASLVDNVTLPWRQKSQKSSMSDIFELIDVYKYKIASLQAIYPFDLEDKKYLFNYLQENDLILDSQFFSPMCSIDRSTPEKQFPTSELTGSLNVVCRGIENKHVKNLKDKFYFDEIVPASCVLDRYLMDLYPKSKTKSFSIQTALDVSLPFPNIFGDEMFGASPNKKRNITVKEIQYITIMQMNNKIQKWLKFLNESIVKTPTTKKIKYLETGLEYDDFADLISFSHDLCDLYSA